MTSHDNVTDIENEMRLDAKAFRENTVYDGDGDPIRLIANAERMEQAADTIATLRKQLENARSEALEEALVAVVGTNADGDRSALSAYQKCIYAIHALKGQPC